VIISSISSSGFAKDMIRLIVCLLKNFCFILKQFNQKKQYIHNIFF
jgi:hypothetical protein